MRSKCYAFNMETKNIVRIGVNVFVLKDGGLLWGRRLKKTGGWCLPGGHFEYGERLTAAAVRELKEETGLETNESDLEFIQLINDPQEDCHYVHINFLAKEWSGEPKVMEPEKFGDWTWFDLAEPPEHIFSGHKLFLPAFLKKINFIP